MSLLFSWIVQAAMWVYAGLCWTGPVFSYVLAGVLVVWYLVVCYAVGYVSANRYRGPFWRWFFLALLVSPVLALLFLLARRLGPDLGRADPD